LKRISASVIVITLIIGILLPTLIQTAPTNAQIPRYYLYVSLSGSGSVTYNGTGVYDAGDVVEISAYPSAGWEFAGWSGDLGGSDSPEHITMDGNKTVTATFTEIPLHAGISLTKTPSATRVLNGTTVSYLYNATNTGDTALTGGIYDDEFGAVGYFVDLQPGGWVGFNVSHVLTHSTYNVATAYGVDQYGQNVTSTASAYVKVRTPYACISLTKTPSATIVWTGTSVSYLYNVTNAGYTALTGAIYDDEFGLVGNYVNLAPGGWVAFNVTHVLTHSTYNTATAYGVDQYGTKVTSTASAYVKVRNPCEYHRWYYYHFRTRYHS
jgi:uncharacterized repeat protein (TIGR02543 family)